MRQFIPALVALMLLAGIARMCVLDFQPTLQIKTDKGYQPAAQLEDGSVVFVTPDSSLIAFAQKDARRVSLTHGRARFVVTPDAARPFTVTTPHVNATVRGTIFSVNVLPKRTTVAVDEGRVEVATNEGGSAEGDNSKAASRLAREVLVAGQSVAMTDGGKVIRRVRIPVQLTAREVDKVLSVREEPLGELVLRFNRYGSVRLRVEGADLADFLVSGTFDFSDARGLLDYLTRFEGVTATRMADGVIVVKRKEAE